MSRYDDDALDKLDRGIWFAVPLPAWVRLAAQWSAAIGMSLAMYSVPFGPALYVMSGALEQGEPEPEDDDDDEPFYEIAFSDDLEPEPIRAPTAPAPRQTIVVQRVRATRPDPLPQALPEVPEPPVVPPPDDAVADTDVEPPDEVVERKRRARRDAKKPRKGSEPKPPCEPVDGIVQLGEHHYLVKRELVEFYATHPFQLDQLASVWTHKDAAGQPDGFKLGLPRCTVLRAAGFRSSDVVNDVNGRVISTVPQAIGAYFALRREEVYYLHVTRKDPKTKALRQLELTFEIEEKDRKRRRQADDEAIDTDAPTVAAPPTVEDAPRPRRRDRTR